MTTLISYGEVSCQRQGDIILGLATPEQGAQSGASEFADEVVKKLRESGVTI